MATRERPVTQSDVAKAAGVSRGLVSQALSGSGRMSPSTRTHIRETADKLGYYPHSAAAELAGGHSKRLVLILPYLTNPYFDELSSHLRVAASARGYSLIVMVSDLTRSSQVERDTIAEAVGLHPAGIIFIGTSQSTDELVTLSRRVTVCTLDRSVPDGTIWAVRIDEAAAARAIVSHLLTQGYRSLCYLSPPPSHREAIVCERVAQCRRAAAREGMALHELDGADVEASVAAAARMAAPALIAFNDMVATHAATAAYRHGLTLGSDLGIVGYDDIDLARRPGFEISSINQNPQRLAQATVSSVLSAPSHEATTVSTVPRLIVRQSSTRWSS